MFGVCVFSGMEYIDADALQSSHVPLYQPQLVWAGAQGSTTTPGCRSLLGPQHLPLALPRVGAEECCTSCMGSPRWGSADQHSSIRKVGEEGGKGRKNCQFQLTLTVAYCMVKYASEVQ